MSPRFAFGLALVVLLGLLLTPVLIPMVLTSGNNDGDDNLGGVPVNTGVPGCSMYCTEAPVSVPMSSPDAPVCPMFCDEGSVSLPLSAPEVK
ncbi:hypothetical protein [Nocardia salmonicida]|uniref:hypothetical protein n=1 Tax=Nocardia salmonicida TaxID=53431 RepID=UPI0007A414F6|nr:hypothetical protein [Nocardia salmonicida]